MFDTEFQCARIRAIRDMARQEGVSLFINLRSTSWLQTLAPRCGNWKRPGSHASAWTPP
jgi:hypothetical protein